MDRWILVHHTGNTTTKLSADTHTSCSCETSTWQGAYLLKNLCLEQMIKLLATQSNQLTNTTNNNCIQRRNSRFLYSKAQIKIFVFKGANQDFCIQRRKSKFLYSKVQIKIFVFKGANQDFCIQRSKSRFLYSKVQIKIFVFKGANQDFCIQRCKSRFLYSKVQIKICYNLLTVPQTVSNTYTQVTWAQSCANHVQHIKRLLRATCRVM